MYDQLTALVILTASAVWLLAGCVWYARKGN